MNGLQVRARPFHWTSSTLAEEVLCENCLHIMWIRSGTVCLKLQQRVAQLGPHYLFSLTKSCQEVRIQEPVIGYHLEVDPEFVCASLPKPLPPCLGEFLQRLTSSPFCVHFSQRGASDAEWLLYRLLQQDDRFGDLVWASNRLTMGQFLLLCYQEWLSTQTKDPSRISTAAEDVVRVIRQYIDKHFHEQLSLKQLSDRSGYSPCYLSSVFSKTHGQGLSTYITQRRIERAQELLKSSNLKVIEICYGVGFRDVAHFNRTFKVFTGVPPSQYRRSERRVAAYQRNTSHCAQFVSEVSHASLGI
ncbi:MAG: helix-turn-helix domain-containing protein [Acidobacteriota bacterium]